MGVDVFDLPAGGVQARERGQGHALPPQVLQCIRDRHGLPDFAGGRRSLDAAYEAEEARVEGGRQGTGDEGEPSLPPPPPPLLFPGLRLLHAEPPVIGVDDFFTPEECDEYISRSLGPPPQPSPAAATGGGVVLGSGGGNGGGGGPHMQRSATLGADVDAVAQVRGWPAG